MPPKQLPKFFEIYFCLLLYTRYYILIAAEVTTIKTPHTIISYQASQIHKHTHTHNERITIQKVAMSKGQNVAASLPRMRAYIQRGREKDVVDIWWQISYFKSIRRITSGCERVLGCVYIVYTRKIDRWWWGVWSHENGRDGFRSEKITNPKISSSSSSSLHLPAMKINMRSFWTLLCVTICLGVGFVYTMLGSAQLSS